MHISYLNDKNKPMTKRDMIDLNTVLNDVPSLVPASSFVSPVGHFSSCIPLGEHCLVN